MRLNINKEQILPALQSVIGVVERRQTLPILSNLLFIVDGSTVTLVATDMEVELKYHLELESPALASGSITVPARKLFDICKALPDSASIEFELTDDKLKIKSGKSRFNLTTLPVNDFPNITDLGAMETINLEANKLKALIDETQFAMAHQDVRYYLNGLMFELSSEYLRAIATDGHRLALSETAVSTQLSDKNQIILPRKGVLELSKMLDDSDESLSFVFSSNHIRVQFHQQTLTSKLIDGKFPDYDRVLPTTAGFKLVGDTEDLKQGLMRTAILSNEKFRGVRLQFSENKIVAVANNPEHEEAEEEILVSYTGDSFEIGFNVSYLLDVLNTIRTPQVDLYLSSPDSSCLITPSADDTGSKYVVMPMRI